MMMIFFWVFIALTYTCANAAPHIEESGNGVATGEPTVEMLICPICEEARRVMLHFYYTYRSLDCAYSNFSTQMLVFDFDLDDAINELLKSDCNYTSEQKQKALDIKIRHWQMWINYGKILDGDSKIHYDVLDPLLTVLSQLCEGACTTEINWNHPKAVTPTDLNNVCFAFL